MSKNKFLDYEKIKQTIMDNKLVVKNENTLLLDSTYVDLYNEIVTDSSILLSKQFLESSASYKYVKDSINLWDELGIKLNDIAIIDNSFTISDNSWFIACEGLFESMIYDSPSYLPIKFIKNKKEINGGLKGITIENFSLNKTENYTFFSEIYLSRLNNELTSCIYNHEITHTQLSILDNECISTLDIETIPILIEEIFAYKLDSSLNTLIKIRNIRLLNLSKKIFERVTLENLSLEKRIELDTYIKSSLQAIKLANIYLNGSTNIQKNMQDNINQLFKEEVGLGDILNKYEANLSDIPRDIKTLKKI